LLICAQILLGQQTKKEATAEKKNIEEVEEQGGEEELCI